MSGFQKGETDPQKEWKGREATAVCGDRCLTQAFSPTLALARFGLRGAAQHDYDLHNSVSRLLSPTKALPSSSRTVHQPMRYTFAVHDQRQPKQAQRLIMNVPMLAANTAHMKPTIGWGPTRCTSSPEIGIQISVARLATK